MAVDYAAKKQPRRMRLLLLLRDLGWHSWRECMEAGGMRYSARLLELVHQGYQVEKRDWLNAATGEPDGKQYRLTSLERIEPPTKQVKIYLPEKDTEALLRQWLPEGCRERIEAALASFQGRKGML